MTGETMPPVTMPPVTMTPVTIDVFMPGRVCLGGYTFQCALGPAGIVLTKKEGDHATPAGAFTLRQVMYRPDRIARPVTGLPVRPVRETDGWCDDPNHKDYNRLITLPHDSRHEVLWRDDHVYDVVVETGYNDDPPVPGRGSAIFIHVAHDDYATTEGCVALGMKDLLKVLELCGPGSVLQINPD